MSQPDRKLSSRRGECVLHRVSDDAVTLSVPTEPWNPNLQPWRRPPTLRIEAQPDGTLRLSVAKASP